MIGWHITVYRKARDGSKPATVKSAQGARVAVWQTGAGGLDWVDDLVRKRKATMLKDGGYPSLYTARAKQLIPSLAQGANKIWRRDPGDVVGEGWIGTTQIDEAVLSACDPEEWLILQAWDES